MAITVFGWIYPIRKWRESRENVFNPQYNLHTLKTPKSWNFELNVVKPGTHKSHELIIIRISSNWIKIILWQFGLWWERKLYERSIVHQSCAYCTTYLPIPIADRSLCLFFSYSRFHPLQNMQANQPSLSSSSVAEGSHSSDSSSFRLIFR